METALKRNYRSRYSPRKLHGRPVSITARDVRIFELLDKYGALDTDQIHAFVGGCRQWLNVRLRRLYDESYIATVDHQKNNRPLHCPLIRQNDEKAKEILKARGLLHGVPMPTKHFHHQMMMRDTFAALELGGAQVIRMPARKAPVSISYTFPTGHTQSKAFDHHHDALAKIYLDDGAHRFWQFEFEHDLNVEPSSLEPRSTLKHILSIESMMKGRSYKDWGLPTLMTLIVARNEHHAERIRGVIGKVLTCGGCKENKKPHAGCSYIAVTHMPSIYDDRKTATDLYTRPLLRAGHADFHFNK